MWCHSLIEYSKESIISFGMGAADYGGRAKLDDPLRGGEPNLTTREGERDKFSRRPVRGETFWTFLREGSEFMNRGPRAEVGGRENFRGGHKINLTIFFFLGVGDFFHFTIRS